MHPKSSSPLALVSRALVAERLDLMPGVGTAIDDTVYIRIADTLVRQPRPQRAKHKRVRLGR